VPNADMSGYLPPYAYASVKIDWQSTTTAQITVKAYSGYFLGSGGIIALNTTGGAATASGAIFSANPYTGNINYIFDQGAGNVSDFGKFDLVIKSFDGYGYSTTGFSFLLTNKSATPWTNAAGVLTPDNLGFTAAGHIFVDGGADGSPMTGFVGNGTTSVPEPNTMILLGSGLLGLAFYGRRKFKK